MGSTASSDLWLFSVSSDLDFIRIRGRMPPHFLIRFSLLASFRSDWFCFSTASSLIEYRFASFLPPSVLRSSPVLVPFPLHSCPLNPLIPSSSTVMLRQMMMSVWQTAA